MNVERVFDALVDWNLWGNYRARLKEREGIPDLHPKIVSNPENREVDKT